MLMRANFLSEQWDVEVRAVRERWKSAGGESYKWDAENIRESVKREYFEEDEKVKMPEISGEIRNAASSNNGHAPNRNVVAEPF